MNFAAFPRPTPAPTTPLSHHACRWTGQAPRRATGGYHMLPLMYEQYKKVDRRFETDELNSWLVLGRLPHTHWLQWVYPLKAHPVRCPRFLISDCWKGAGVLGWPGRPGRVALKVAPQRERFYAPKGLGGWREITGRVQTNFPDRSFVPIRCINIPGHRQISHCFRVLPPLPPI